MAPIPTRTVIAPPPAPPVQLGEDGQPVAPPVIVPDVITRLAPSTNTETNTGTTTIIDVHPKMQFPIMSWIYSLCHSIPSTAFSSHPLASPASVLCYTQIMYIALLYYNDAYLRFVPSPFAFQILNDSRLKFIFDQLIEYAVPSFALAEFEALRPYYDDLAENLYYFGTLAGSSFYHDFQNLPPASIFSGLHNLLSQLATNTSYAVLSANFYAQTACQVTITGQTTPDINLTPSHYFAQFFSTTADGNTTTHRYDNWFNRYVDQFITANAIRVVNASATVTRLPLTLPARTSTGNYNPYLYATGIHEDSLDTFTELVRNLNDFVKTSFPHSKPLRAYTQYGNQEIIRHLSFQSVLPTFHNGAAPSLDALKANDCRAVLSQTVSATTFATEIQYLVNRPAPSATNVPPAIALAQGRALDGNTDTRLDFVLPTTGAPTTDPAPLRLFNTRAHVLPRCTIFDPSASQTAHLSAVITSGKVIEHNDISAIGIPTTSATENLGQTNSQFILGAIPMSQVQPQITHVPFVVRRRNHGTNFRIPQIILRAMPDRIILPLFRTGLVQPTTAVPTTTGPHQAFFPGISFNNNMWNASDGINAFAFPVGSPSPSIPEQFFQLWSSYRYYDAESRTWYMLPSLRHIYGTRTRTTISEHPALRIR
jgi:hypothetical protein